MATDAHAKLAVATWKGSTNLVAAHDVTVYTSCPTFIKFIQLSSHLICGYLM